MENKLKKILSPAYSLKLKNIILFLNWDLIFFSNGHIHNVVSMLPNVVKVFFENGNVVSTLSNVVQTNVEMENVDSTLFNVVNFNFDVHKVVSTLIWHCATFRRHISIKTTLKRHWNVSWVIYLSIPIDNVLCRAKVGHLNAFKYRMQRNWEMRYPLSFLKIIPFLVYFIFSRLIHCISIIFHYISSIFRSITNYLEAGKCGDALSTIYENLIKLMQWYRD